jgi:hypothetical protein
MAQAIDMNRNIALTLADSMKMSTASRSRDFA